MTVLFLGIDPGAPVALAARDAGLAQEMRFLGFRDRPLPFYRLFDVMVLPSSIEGFSLAILEAMKTRYVLRFEPDRVKRPGLHELAVKLTRRKGRVHCRKGYFVGAHTP